VIRRDPFSIFGSPMDEPCPAPAPRSAALLDVGLAAVGTDGGLTGLAWHEGALLVLGSTEKHRVTFCF
jgi:hypothetical protein